MNVLAAKGDGAVVQWGYQVAATIGRWALNYDHGPEDESPGAPRHRFVGQVRSSQPLVLRQRPLTLVIPRPAGVAWRWPILDVQRQDPDTLAMVLGAKEP